MQTPISNQINLHRLILNYLYPDLEKNKEKEIKKQVQELLSVGFIKYSNSSFHSPVLLVEKKKNGTCRFCVDHRASNALTSRVIFLPLRWMSYMVLSGFQN